MNSNIIERPIKSSRLFFAPNNFWRIPFISLPQLKRPSHAAYNWSHLIRFSQNFARNSEISLSGKISLDITPVIRSTSVVGCRYRQCPSLNFCTFYRFCAPTRVLPTSFLNQPKYVIKVSYWSFIFETTNCFLRENTAREESPK